MRQYDTVDEWLRNRAVKNAMTPWLAQLYPWTCFGTVAPCPSHPLDADRYKTLFRHWDAKVCHALIGARWQKVTNDHRPVMAVYFEGGLKSDNLHIHFLVHVPPQWLPRYGTVVMKVWNGLDQNMAGKRDLQLKPICGTLPDRLRAAGYAMKNVAGPDNMAGWDFIP